MKSLPLMLALTMLCAGCATSRAPASDPLRLPPPSAESMRAVQPSFLCEMQSFLSGTPVEQIESSCSYKPASENSKQSQKQ